MFLVLFVVQASVLVAGRYIPFAGTTEPVALKSGESIPFVPSIVTGIYTTTQVEPLGTVTVTPDATAIGPALLAFDPLGIE